jgi:protein-S-isoprenylcysteine O-methyltransferase Ste14
MGTDSESDAARVKVFPPGVPLVTILAGLGLESLFPLGPGDALPDWARFGLGGALVAGAFGLIGLPAVLTMRRTGQSENPYKPTTQIVESGPFRFTRNPMYLQMVLICLGAALLLANAWIVLLTPLCWAALDRLVVRPEETYLERKFGEPYRAYKRRVRRWL